MKKNSFVAACTLMMLYLSLSCTHIGNHNTSIAISDSKHYYKMVAHFNRSKTYKVERYMDHAIGNASNMSFTHTHIDGELAFDDHTTIYIKKYSGFLEIKFDKHQNSDEAYYKIKSMCDGIKNVVTK